MFAPADHSDAKTPLKIKIDGDDLSEQNLGERIGCGPHMGLWPCIVPTWT